MILPDTNIEKNFYGKSDGSLVIGIDEAGRGPLAGPVVAAAVWVNPSVLDSDFKLKQLIRDSKTLSAKQREKVFEYLERSNEYVIGVGEISHLIIDKVNILNAALLAMRFALEDLLEKVQLAVKSGGLDLKNIAAEKLFVLVDGDKKIPKINFQQHLFPKGDQKVFSIAAASICAKVQRDRMMDVFHKQYPKYGFDCHRGYGTRMHMENLQKYGPCDIHRKSFAPIKGIFQKQKNI